MTIFMAKASAFRQDVERYHLFSVTKDGELRIWDPIAGHFTLHHGLTSAQVRKLSGSLR